MSHFFAALQFLTAFPIDRNFGFEPRKMVPYFPVVGLLLGGVLFLLDHGFLSLWPPAAASLLDVIALAVLTGALIILVIGLAGGRKED